MRRRFRSLCLLSCVLSAIVGSFVHNRPALGDDAGRESSTHLAFRDVRVFDGSRVLTGATVIVRDGKIAAVGADVAIPAGAAVIEGAGHTLLPGLIDSHTHVIEPTALKQALVFGVTTEVDMFSWHRMIAQVKKLQAAGGNPDMADVFSACTLVTAPGGHGTEYGLDIPTIGGPEEAQAFVDDRIAEGSDFIKIIYGGRPSINRATLKAVVDAAHKRGKMAVAHIGTFRGAREAIEAGVDGLAHLFVDRAPEPGFGRFVAEHKAFVIPTLTVLESCACGSPGGASLVQDSRLAPYLTPTDIKSLKLAFPPQRSLSPAQEAVRRLKAAGVPILAGTDAPNPGTAHGASIHRELELLVQAGLTPTEALASATSVPAKAFGLDDRGRIAPGLRADLLLVKGDPTTDIKAARDIAGIWKCGVRLDRAAYRTSIEEQTGSARAKEQAPISSDNESGLVSDFEDGKASAKFGFGWQVSTDAMTGGKSTARFKVVTGGAGDSKHSLSITGKIVEGIEYAWAGAMFIPGRFPMMPADMSSHKRLTFWAKGDGKTYHAMLFAQSRGWNASIRTFTAGPKWKEFGFPLSEFDGMDGHDLTGVFFGGGAASGEFAFQIDDVRFE